VNPEKNAALPPFDLNAVCPIKMLEMFVVIGVLMLILGIISPENVLVVLPPDTSSSSWVLSGFSRVEDVMTLWFDFWFGQDLRKAFASVGWQRLGRLCFKALSGKLFLPSVVVVVGCVVVAGGCLLDVRVVQWCGGVVNATKWESRHIYGVVASAANGLTKLELVCVHAPIASCVRVLIAVPTGNLFAFQGGQLIGD
jgi:hypothetical protein